MKVKIIDTAESYRWYASHIGNVFEVMGGGVCAAHTYTVSSGSKQGCGIMKSDCEIVDEDSAPKATKLVTHEGITYIVPAWATCLTRDSTGRAVFEWENTPTWSEVIGYTCQNGKRGIAQVYVPPKPDGHFIAAI